MTTCTIIAMVLSIVCKGLLFILSARVNHPTVTVLNEDSLQCTGRKDKEGSSCYRYTLKIVISVCILILWDLRAHKNVRYLTGLVTEPFVLQKLTHTVYNYCPNLVTKIDSVQAIHFGTNYLAEIDIGLPRSTLLAIARDIGFNLQNQIEALDDIERAYVHLDFEFTHMPPIEHERVF